MQNAESIEANLAPNSALLTPNSSLLLPGRLISRTPPFEGGRAGASPAPAANFQVQSEECKVMSVNEPRILHSALCIHHFTGPLAQNQSGSLTNCGRWRVTSTGYQFCR